MSMYLIAVGMIICFIPCFFIYFNPTYYLLKIIFNLIHYLTLEYYLIYSLMFSKFTNIIVLNEYANLNFNPTHNFMLFY